MRPDDGQTLAGSIPTNAPQAPPSPPRARLLRARGLRAVAVALILGLAALLALQTQADPDLWGHVRYGLDALDLRAIPRTDPYSYLTVPGTWVNHEWLAEVLMALAWRGGGALGLVRLKFAVLLATLGALLAALRRQGSPLMPALLAMLLASGMLTRNFRTIRPQMFSAACFAVLLLVMVEAEKGRRRALLALPPLFAVWVNAHGGVLAGVGFLGLWVLGRVIVLRRQAWPELAAAAAALLATLANPYGAGLWRFLLSTATVPRPEIGDWTPLFRTGPALIAFYVGVLGLSLGVMLWRRARPPLGLALVYGAATLLPLAASRHLDFLALAGPVVAAPYLPQFAQARRELGELLARRPAASSAVALLATSGVWLALALLPGCPSTARGEVRWPARAVAVLRGTRSSGRMLVPFNWGQYALWHLGPRLQVSMDGRRETVYDRATYTAYAAFHYGADGWERYVALGDPDLALLPPSAPAYALLSSDPEWEEVYADGVAVILARRGSAFAVDVPRQAARGAAALGEECFP